MEWHKESLWKFHTGGEQLKLRQEETIIKLSDAAWNIYLEAVNAARNSLHEIVVTRNNIYGTASQGNWLIRLSLFVF